MSKSKYSPYYADGSLKPYSFRYRPDDYHKKRYERYKTMWRRLQVSLSHEDDELLRRYAKVKKVPVSELVQTYIVWGLENEDTRFKTAALKLNVVDLKEQRTIYHARQEEILKDWKAGEKATVIAKKYGVHDSYPGQLAKKRGLPPRHPGGKNSEVWLASLKKLRTA